ncbi:MAG: DUF2520 domain-containing protein [Terriglobales bacterium]
MTGKFIAEKSWTGKPSVAIVGAGRLASFLAMTLHDAGFTIAEIITRDSPRSRRRALALAAKVGARIATARSAVLDTTLLWFCVPDAEIHGAAAALAARVAASATASMPRLAFHSSGALLSSELDPLRQAGVRVASVHPLMTFVAGENPSLAGVPFALEGDDAATKIARRIVRELGGKSFSLAASRKAAYHAWATMTSPLLLAFFVALEEAAHAAGLTPREARSKSLPILRQTLENYARLGAARSFTGPLVRGDAETVVKHLAVLKKYPGTRDVYGALARAALRGLPVKNRSELEKLLRAFNPDPNERCR